MAISFIDKARQTGNTVASFNMSFDVGTGPDRLLVVTLLQRGTPLRDVASITFDSIALSAGPTASNTVPASNLRAQIFYLVNPPSGLKTLSVSASGGNFSQYECQVAWYIGVAQTAPLDQTATAADISNAPSVNITPLEDNELIVGGIIHEDPNALTTGSGETAIYNNDNGAWVTSTSYAVQTTAATQAINWTAGTSDYFALAAASFKPGEVNTPPTVALNTLDAVTLDTTPTLEFTGTDDQGDNIRYQIQISNRNDFAGAGSLIGEYFNGMHSGIIHPNPSATLTWEGNYQVDDRPGQSFTAKGGILDKIRVSFGPDLNTDGFARIRVYEHQGTYGTSSAPLNAVTYDNTPTPGWIAQSDNYPFTTLGTDGWHDITFSGANRIQLEPGKYYVFILDWIPVNSTYDNTITVKVYSTDPNAHPGNLYIDGFAAPNNGPQPWDMLFEVYEAGVFLDKVSGTDAGFENTITPADTDPFNSGEKVSFTVQAGDTLPETIYHWKVRATDPGGTGLWSDYTSVRTFTATSSSGVTVDLSGSPSVFRTATANPGVILGAVTLTPAPSVFKTATANPGVILGAVTLTPGPASFRVSTVNPLAIQGAITLTPAASVFRLSTSGPQVSTGGITVDLSGSPASFRLSTLAPQVILGPVTFSPAASVFRTETANPLAILGAITLTPGVASFRVSTTGPTIFIGGITFTPAPVVFRTATANPLIILGPVSFSPAPASFRLSTTGPTILAGGITLTPAPVTFRLSTANPETILGPITLTPAASAFRVSTANPFIILGPITLTPALVVFRLSTSGPQVFGSDSIGYITLLDSLIYSLDISDLTRDPLQAEDFTRDPLNISDWKPPL